VPQAGDAGGLDRRGLAVTGDGDLLGHGGGGQIGKGGQPVTFSRGRPRRPVRTGGSSCRAASLRSRVVQVTRCGSFFSSPPA
jgi:hypothetical protein